MRKAIGIWHNPDSEEAPLTIYYNGPDELITAERGKHCEYTEYCPVNEADARKAAKRFWGDWPWDYEELI